MQSNEVAEIKDPKMEVFIKETEDLETSTSTTKPSPDVDSKVVVGGGDDHEIDVMAPSSSTGMRHAPYSSTSDDKPSVKCDDDEVLSLQVLSSRSSTPYTIQAICCNSVNCGLNPSDTTSVSPIKEEETQPITDDQKDPVDEELHATEASNGDKTGKTYSRSDLLAIRGEMVENTKPQFLEELKYLNFLKSENGLANGFSGNGNKHKQYRYSSSSNDLMPAFFKRRATVSNGSNGHSYYEPQNLRKSVDTHHSHRRIGSGRLQNLDLHNWDYISEKDDAHRDNTPDFYSARDNSSYNSNKRNFRKYDLDENQNQIKRTNSLGNVDSSMRSASSRNYQNMSADEQCNNNNTSGSTSNNKSDEPEWFCCGPSSRLDTIELCGFNEAERQQIGLDITKMSTTTDVNNNQEVPQSTLPKTTTEGTKEKKQLAFQFDEFTTYNGKYTSTHHHQQGNNNKTSSSKLMPLFNIKNKDENANYSQSFTDFIKRSDISTVGQRERLNLSDIPRVDEIEAKWKIQQSGELRTNNENNCSGSENFKKMLSKLHQHQSSGIQHALPENHPSMQTQLNLFNTEKLSNFIKQRNLQQQVLQRQQQAALAQLQFNAILNRPEAQMLLLSLARGEISKQGLMVQLANPNLTQIDRDIISTVLSFSSTGQCYNNLHQQFITNQLQNIAFLQQLNKSTSTNKTVTNNASLQGSSSCGNASHLRTYSQEELQSHANYILHNAMMKKKLEEQTNLGVQKILQLQNTMWTNNSFNNSRGTEPVSGSKNSNIWHHQHQHQHQQQHKHTLPKHVQQQQYQHLMQQHPQQHQQQNANIARPKKPLNIVAPAETQPKESRRRSTSSSSSSNATIKTSQPKITTDLDLEVHNLGQSRNAIVSETVEGDEFHKIS